MAAARERRWWPPPPLVLAAAGVLVVQTVVLWVLRVPLTLQASVLLTAFGATLAGAGLLRGSTEAIGDVGARVAIWYLAGMAAISGVSYVLFHPGVAHFLGLDGPAAATGLSLSLVGLVALVVGLLRRPDRTRKPSGLGKDGVAVLLLALTLSGATVYGVANTVFGVADHPRMRLILSALDSEHLLVGSRLPEWGERDDFYYHLVKRPVQIWEQGLPLESVEHHGLQVWLLSSSVTFDHFDVADPVQAAKVLAVPVWFSLLILAHFSARRVLKLGRPASLVVVAAVALFAPINYPLLETSRSSYRGLISSSGSMYHNATQLYSVAMGMAAVALIGVAAEGGRLRARPLVAASVLITASFWFKPSLYVVMAPAMVLAVALVGREHRRSLVRVVLVLLLPVLWWVVYPRLVGVRTPQLGPVVDVFGGYRARAVDRFPTWISSSLLRTGMAVLVLSFAAWVIPVSAWGARTVSALRRRGGAALRGLAHSALPVVLVTALVLGVGMAVTLAQQGRGAAHGNFTWSGAAAYVLSLPLLVRLVMDVRSVIWRWVCGVVLALHLAAGGLHLWILVTAGHL